MQSRSTIVGDSRADTPALETHAAHLRVLLIEDDADISEAIQQLLESEGHRVVAAFDGESAMERIQRNGFDLVVSDVRLPKGDGMTILGWLREHAPDTSVVLMSAYGTIAEAVASVRQHATHYLSKPFEPEELLEVVREVALNTRGRVQPDLALGDPTARLVGDSAGMAALRRRITAISGSEAAVLISGESGTGKELVARALHDSSARANGPFVPVNCAALPETLLEAELFGHEKGAFTGALRRREGRFVAANDGTLFLDEVADISPSAQAKLLRVLQEGTFQAVGTNTTLTSNARIVSATNSDLKQRVAEGKFREDLYYRLKVFEIHIPPLRERRADIAVLVGHFRGKLSGAGTVPGLSARAWSALYHHAFPGNVRELEHAIEHAIILSGGGEIDLHHLPDEFHGDVGSDESADAGIRPLGEALRAFEQDYLYRALSETGGQKTRAARLLRISRKTLWMKLRRYGVETDDTPET